MICRNGHNVNVPPRVETRLLREYLEGGRPEYWLHSVCYTEEEMLEILKQRAEVEEAKP
jgi:hypothetical protein